MSGGRCEKAGCNQILYESPITHEPLNEAQVAHIIPVSDKGPRGEFLHLIGNRDEIDNLMLLCPQCHKEIDTHPDLYTVEDLKKMKQQHEERIRYLTSITSDRECLTVIYSSSIERDITGINMIEMQQALADIRHYSSFDHQLNISTSIEGIKDGEAMEEKALAMTRLFDRRVAPLIEQTKLPIAVFALAPIPLLIKLGTLFPTGTKLMPFLKLRYSQQNEHFWKYEPNGNVACPFRFIRPKQIYPNNNVALTLETTDKIAESRILEAFIEKSHTDIWKIQHQCPDYDLDSSESVLNHWMNMIMQAMNTIRGIYGQQVVHIFPAINNALAIMAGVARVSKTDPEWIIYDNIKTGDGKSHFVKSLSIGGEL